VFASASIRFDSFPFRWVSLRIMLTLMRAAVVKKCKRAHRYRFISLVAKLL